MATNAGDRIIWLAMSEAARYLGISEPTLRKWTDEGLVSAFRTPGGHRRYRQEELVRFREEREERHPPLSEEK